METEAETWEERVTRERREKRERALAIMSCIAEGADAVLSEKLGGAWAVTVKDRGADYWNGGYVVEVMIGTPGIRRFTVSFTQDQMVEVSPDLPDGVEHRHLRERLPCAKFSPARGPVGLAGAIRRIIAESARIIEEAEEAAIRERGYMCRTAANAERICHALGVTMCAPNATIYAHHQRLGSIEVDVHGDTARVKMSGVPIDELARMLTGD